MGMWGNFSKDEDEENLDQITATEEKEPIKLIDSVNTLTALVNRQKELSAEILSGIDKEQSLSKQLSTLNLDELNKAASKETTYKTEEEYDNAYMNQVLNHNNNDLFKSSANFAVSTERKKRYEIYEQMLDSNYIVERVLEVFCENIIIRNAQTKSYINTQINDNKMALFDSLGNDIKNSYDKLCKALLIKYKLQKQLKDTIVPNVCTFGNYFVEIVDLNLLNNLGGITAHEQVIMDSSGQTLIDEFGNEIKGQKPNNIKTENLLLESTIYTYEKNKKKDTERKPEIIQTNIIFESNFDCYESEQDLYNAIQNKDFENILNNGKESIQESSTPKTKKRKIKVLNENGQEIEKEEDILETPHLDSFLQEMLQENSLDQVDLSFFDNMDLMGNETDTQEQFNIKDITTLKLDALKDIYLDYHHPKNVIIIEKNNLIYGYLIIEDDTSQGQGSYEVDRFKRFSAGLSSHNTTGFETYDNSQVIKDATDSITKEILKKITSNIRLNKNRMLGQNFDYFKTLNIGEEATASLKLLIYQKIKYKSKLKFRFLTPDSIINFTGQVNNKFAPYGTSIFDKMVQPVKLYTLALMSSIVSRLSRAAVVRKWTIEAGDKRNHEEIVAKTTSDLKSKAITFDKINQMKNTAEIITDYRDMATITINQQRFIDMEILPMQDRGLPLNDMNDLKQDVIAAGGVPGIYLNITDSVDLREKLVHLNITFANNIINKQASIEEGLDQFLNCMFKKVLKYNNYKEQDFNLSNYINYKLNPPLVLQLQSDEAQITIVQNIVNALDGLKLPSDPRKILQRYIPNINWDTIYKEGQNYKQELGKQAIITPDNQQGY